MSGNIERFKNKKLLKFLTEYFVLSIIEMKILFHILLDMNQKTKISTKFPRSKLGVATAVLSLGGVAVYSLGVINPLQASQSEYLQVDGVQNSVQYLTSLVIDSPTAKVEFKYDDASKAVRALGSLNMQNLVVGQGNESSASSVVFWWTENNNQWANSVIVWGNSTTNEGNNNVIVLSPGSNSRSENTAILNGQNVVTNGKNITVVNGETNVRGNYVTVFGNSSVAADHVVVFGDKVNNNKSNTFVFNGQDAEFVPEQESAFYANSKVAINGDHANATLDVHGGMMIGHRKMGQSNTYTAWKNPATSGTIALFSKRKKTGLCGYDGKDNRRRVPLSESARKFWLCAPVWKIWDLPKNAVSNNPQRSFPQVWNQNGRWEWESPKWIYGSKKEPQHFLCADGYVPDVADPIGKTGVKCIPCEWAKLGDLNCTTQKADNSAAKPHCPQGTNYNETSKKCEGTKSTPCVAWDNIVRFSPDTQIETYNADTWIWDITQKCEAEKCQEGFTLEDKRCVKKTTPTGSCIGEIPNGGKVNPNASKPTSTNTKRVAVKAESTLPCSYLCADGFILGEDRSGNPACLQCEDWSRNPDRRTCRAKASCQPWYTNNPQNQTQCIAIWNCMINGKIDESYNNGQNRIVPKNFQPLGENLSWQYVDKDPEPYKCQFTCEKGQVVTSDRECANRKCEDWKIKDYTDMESYINLEPIRWVWDGVFVDIEGITQQELQAKRAEKAKGCFYACKNSKIFYKGKCLSQEAKELEIQKEEEEEREREKLKASEELCEFSYSVWTTALIEFYEIIRNPTGKSQKFVYQDPLPSTSTPWCFYKCKNGATATDISDRPGLKRCIPQEPKSCADNEIRSPWDRSTSYIWRCKSCGNWYVPDKDNDLVNGKPTRCKEVDCGTEAVWSAPRKSCITKVVYATCPTGFSRTKQGCERCLFNQILTENGCVDKK